MPKNQIIEQKSTAMSAGDINLSKDAQHIMYNTLKFYLTSPNEGKVLLCIRGGNEFNSMGRSIPLRTIEKETGLPSSTLKSSGIGILPRLIKRGLVKNRGNAYELTGLGRTVTEGYYAFVNTILPELVTEGAKLPELIKEEGGKIKISDLQKMKIMVKKK